MEIIQHHLLSMIFFTIPTGDPRISEPSTVGKKTRFFERLIRQSWFGHTFFCRSSLRTSVARPKSCGALPAMNGTATSGKDLKILERWGPDSWFYFQVEEMIEVFCWKKMPNHKVQDMSRWESSSWSCLWVVNFLGSNTWLSLRKMPTAGLPSSRLSNDLTPTASLPLLVPTPIVSPAERSPTGLGCQRVEFCRRGNVLTWRQLQIEEPCKVIFSSEKRLFFGRNRWKESGFSVLTRYFLLTWFSFTKDLFFSKYFRGHHGHLLGYVSRRAAVDRPQRHRWDGWKISGSVLKTGRKWHHTLSSSVYKLYIWRSCKTLDFHGGGSHENPWRNDNNWTSIFFHICQVGGSTTN